MPRRLQLLASQIAVGVVVQREYIVAMDCSRVLCAQVRATFLVVLSGLGACADSRPDDQPARDGVLTGVSQTSDLQGRALVSDGQVEIFGCNGAWSSWSQPQRWRHQFYGPDVELTGTYTLENGLLCTMPEGDEPSCRSMTMISGSAVTLEAGDTHEVGSHRYSASVVGGAEHCGPMKLPTEEIRRLFAGASLVSDPRVTEHDGPDRLSYECDGTWRSDGVFESRGTYTVANDEICTSVLGSEEYCRQVYRSEGGDLFLGPPAGGSEIVGKIVAPINLVRDVPACE
jgi:hypothetical protein